MEKAETITVAENTELPKESGAKRKFFDIVFLIGFLCCLIPGPLPSMTTVATIVLLLCVAVSFFDENFYLYAALFIYMRYRMLIGGTTAFRLYSYLVVIRFLIDLPKTKFRMAYLPALFVFFLHSIFAVGEFESLRAGMYVIVETSLIYIILLKILADPKLMRKFIFAFIMGGIASGVYGWTNSEVSVDINVRGAGAHTVNRNFGSLGDANFAGLFYGLCIMSSLVLQKIPTALRVVFIALFGVMLLQTASLSAILVLIVLLAFWIILKYRGKSVLILFILLVAAIVGITVLLSVPQFRQIEAIAGLIIRIEEKLSYIPRGRWDLLTTDRSAIWNEVMNVVSAKSIWGKLIGGSVVTVLLIDYSVMSIACHNSYLQSVLNYGLLGTLIIYIPLFVVFIHRLSQHFTKKPGYEIEDLKMLQLLFSFAFIVFGFTVDFFIDWPYMLLYFI